MSSTTQFPPSLTPVSPSPASDNEDDPGGMQRGANYFFGFLITFVALLLIFVGCGLGSRRRYVARRRAMVTAGPWAGDGLSGASSQTEPTFLEPPFVEGAGGDTWGDIAPLALFVAQRKSDSDERPGLSPSITPPTRRRSILSFAFPSRISGAHRHSFTEKEPENEESPAQPAVVHIAVMIAMPLSAKKRPPDKPMKEMPHEYQIGVARVACIGGEIPS